MDGGGTTGKDLKFQPGNTWLLCFVQHPKFCPYSSLVGILRKSYAQQFPREAITLPGSPRLFAPLISLSVTDAFPSSDPSHRLPPLAHNP